MDVCMARAAEISEQDFPSSPPQLSLLQHLCSSFYLSRQPFPLAPTGGTFPADKAAAASAGRLLFLGHRGSPAFSHSCLPFEMCRTAGDTYHSAPLPRFLTGDERAVRWTKCLHPPPLPQGSSRFARERSGTHACPLGTAD